MLQLSSLRGANITNIGIVAVIFLIHLNILTYFHNENWQNTNMLSSLMKASSWLNEYICVISYSDIVYSKYAVKIISEAKGDIVIRMI